MTIQIRLLTEENEKDYQAFLLEMPTSLLYHSIQYRNFLREILIDSKDHYLLAYENGRIMGALPVFEKKSASFGSVINSLPFYGSNGSILISSNFQESEKIKKELLGAFNRLAESCKAAAATLITNPLELNTVKDSDISFTWRDERIGQITPLPKLAGDEALLFETLMDNFHKKTRNSIRKAQKSGFILSHSNSSETLETLAAMHQENLESIGGLFKPPSVFLAIRKNFVYDEDYRIYTAEKDGEIAAALLVFFYNKTAEYFTPAAKQEYRSLQPVSLLALEAMQEAVKRGCQFWNWGGTWKTQDGVYRFKSRFGAEDKMYYYYIKLFNEEMRKADSKSLLKAYPYFYTLPFNKLEGKSE